MRKAARYSHRSLSCQHLFHPSYPTQNTFPSGRTYQPLVLLIATRLSAALATLVRHSRCTHRSHPTYQQPIHEPRFSSRHLFKVRLIFLYKLLCCTWSRGSRNRRSLCHGQHRRRNLAFQAAHPLSLRVNVLEDLEAPDGLEAETTQFQDSEDPFAAIEFCLCVVG